MPTVWDWCVDSVKFTFTSNLYDIHLGQDLDYAIFDFGDEIRCSSWFLKDDSYRYAHSDVNVLTSWCQYGLSVVPLSVLSNWEKQIEDHVVPDALTSCVYYGSGRNMTPAQLKGYDVVLTTYQTVTGEYDEKDGEPKLKKRKAQKSLFAMSWKVNSQCFLDRHVCSNKLAACHPGRRPQHSQSQDKNGKVCLRAERRTSLGPDWHAYCAHWIVRRV